MKITTKHVTKKQTLKSIQVRVEDEWIEVCRRPGREADTAVRRLTKACWIARAL